MGFVGFGLRVWSCGCEFFDDEKNIFGEDGIHLYSPSRSVCSHFVVVVQRKIVIDYHGPLNDVSQSHVPLIPACGAPTT